MAKKTDDTEKKSKKKPVAIALVVVVALGGAYMVLGKKKAAVAAPAGAAAVAKPGVVLTESAQTVNLAGDHYLQVAPALQLMAGVSPADMAKDAPQISDAVITVFSGQSMLRLSTPAGIRGARRQLMRTLAQDYPGDIYGVFFTQFVMQ